MPFLIDGDNLLGTWPGRQRTGAERRKLAMELGRFGSRARRRVVVVFDGRAPRSSAFGADVMFAGSSRSADDLILDFLRRQDDPRGWIVATSDRSLGDRCRHLQARVERCDRFRGRIRHEDTAEKPEREGNVDYWLGQFGGEE
jgi:hypothetical protein